MKRKMYISAAYALRQTIFKELPPAKVLRPLRGLKKDIIAAARGLAFLDASKQNVQWARWYLQDAIKCYRAYMLEPVHQLRDRGLRWYVRWNLDQVLVKLRQPAT
jgi:hypothetical protein